MQNNFSFKFSISYFSLFRKSFPEKLFCCWACTEEKHTKEGRCLQKPVVSNCMSCPDWKWLLCFPWIHLCRKTLCRTSQNYQTKWTAQRDSTVFLSLPKFSNPHMNANIWWKVSQDISSTSYTLYCLWHQQPFTSKTKRYLTH